MSDAPRLEMFARRRRLGWSAFGNECDADVTLVTPNAKLCNSPEAARAQGEKGIESR